MEIEWQKLVKRVSGSLAHKYGLDMWLAEECTYRAFEKVYKNYKAGKIREVKALQHYLYISAKNEFMNQLKSSIPLDNSIPLNKHHGQTPHPDYDGRMDMEAHLRKLDACIDLLQPSDARLIRYTLEHPEMSMAELAEAFNTTEGAIRTRKHRATHRLRNIYIETDVQGSKKKLLPQTPWRHLKEYFTRILKPEGYHLPSLLPSIRPSMINSKT